MANNPGMSWDPLHSMAFHRHLRGAPPAYPRPCADGGGGGGGVAGARSANPRRAATRLRVVRVDAAASAGITTPGRARGPPADTNTAAHDAVAHTLRFPVHLSD